MGEESFVSVNFIIGVSKNNKYSSPHAIDNLKYNVGENKGKDLSHWVSNLLPMGGMFNHGGVDILFSDIVKECSRTIYVDEYVDLPESNEVIVVVRVELNTYLYGMHVIHMISAINYLVDHEFTKDRKATPENTTSIVPGGLATPVIP
jgi:hypothetical protein